LVLAPGAGSELYRGLGSIVLGGLAVSTLFTLVLVPTILSLTLDFQQWLRREPGRISEPVAPGPQPEVAKLLEA
jgi:HAE1 family hydrophobic/amphiphilic exporter-1